MAAEEVRNEPETDVESASVVSQILSDILDSSTDQSEISTPHNEPPSDQQQPTCSNVQQEGDSAHIKPTTARNSDIDDSKSAEDVPVSGPYQTCTVKEILNEILDCTVICRPSLQLPSTSTRSDRNLTVPSPPPEYILDPRLIPSNIYNIRRYSNESTCSRIHCTVKEVISEVMDYTVFKRTDRQVNVHDFNNPGTSRSENLQRGENSREYEMYRVLGAGIVNSTNAIHDEYYLRKSSAIAVQKMLPSYSSVIKMGPPLRIQTIQSACSFVPKKPPPSYAEVEGIWEDSPSLISSESAVFGPDPTYMICPRCRTAVVTDVEVHRSVTTHLLALFLCLCLCWPCCLMPYCLRSCNDSHHSCPHCSYYFGVYRPF